MAKQEKLNTASIPSDQKKEKKELSPSLKKACLTWGIVTVVVSFAMLFASIITFVLVLLRVQWVSFLVSVVLFVAGLASGATGIPLLYASAREKKKKESTSSLKKAYTTWGIVTVVVSFAMFFASIMTFVLVLLRVQGVPFMLGVAFFMAGLASGATGIPLLHASARERAEQSGSVDQQKIVRNQLDAEKSTSTEQEQLPKAANEGDHDEKTEEKEDKKGKVTEKKTKAEKPAAKKET